MRFRDFGCEAPFVSLEDGDVVVTTTVSNTKADREVCREVNKSHIDPWVAIPSGPEDTNRESYFFTIWKSHVIVGEIVLWGFTDGDDGCYDCMISYWVDRNYTNKGIGTKAVSLCINHAFGSLDVDRVEAAIQPDNFASIRLATKLGMHKVADVNNVFRVQGEVVPHELWAIDRVFITF